MNDPVPLNTSQVYFGGSTIPGVNVAESTEARALDSCLSNVRANPEISFRCNWGNVLLFDTLAKIFPPGYLP